MPPNPPGTRSRCHGIAGERYRGYANLARTPARTLAKAARRSGICVLVAFALLGITTLINSEHWMPLALFPGIAAVIAATGFLGYGRADAWQERRSCGQLPRGSRERPMPGAV